MLKKCILIVLISLIICEPPLKSLRIPFKVYKYTIKEEESPNLVFQILSRNDMYSLLEFGNPRQKLACFFTFDNETLTVKGDTNTTLQIKESTYTTAKSKAITFVSTNLISDVKDISIEKYIVQDDLTLGRITNQTSFTFFYDKQMSPNFFAYIGLQLEKQEKANDKVSFNFLSELVKNNFLEKIESFSFYYTKNDEGFFTINEKPYEMKPQDYSEFNSITVPIEELLDWQFHIGSNLKEPWNVKINSVYYYWGEKKEYKEINRLQVRHVPGYQGILRPDYGFIRAPYEYKENIERHFFGKYLNSGACSEIKVRMRDEYFYCDSQYKDEIKLNFPALSITLDNYHLFILEFEDLFVEIGNNLYFLVCFDSYRIEISDHIYISDWTLGAPFLKKFMFTYNVADRSVTYYRKKHEEKTTHLGVAYSTERDSPLKLVLIGVGIFLGIICGVLLFRYLTKKAIEDEKKLSDLSLKRKRKRRFTEFSSNAIKKLKLSSDSKLVALNQ